MSTNPFLRSFTIPKLTAYIGDIQKNFVERLLPVERRAEAKQDLVEAQSMLKEKLESLNAGSWLGIQAWQGQVGMPVLIIFTGTHGTVIGKPPGGGEASDWMVEVRNDITGELANFYIEELKPSIKSNIWRNDF